MFNLKDLLNTGISQAKSHLAGGVDSVKGLLSALEDHAQTYQAPTSPIKLPDLEAMSHSWRQPGIGQTVIDYATQRSAAPSWLKNFTRSMAEQSMNFDPSAVGSLAGPFAGVRNELARIAAVPEGSIGPVFHGTTLPNLQKIMSEGLKPVANRHWGTNVREANYLATDPFIASSYAGRMVDGVPAKGALLMIDHVPTNRLKSDEDITLAKTYLGKNFQDLAQKLQDLNGTWNEKANWQLNRFLDRHYPVESSGRQGPDELYDLLANHLSPEVWREYLPHVDPKALSTLNLANPLIKSGKRDLGANLVTRMLKGKLNQAPEGMSTFTYPDLITPDKIRVIDMPWGDDIVELSGDFATDFPQAARIRQVMQDEKVKQIMDYLSQGKSLPWVLR